MPDQRKRIAIVGAGVSGLAAAHALVAHHDVVVFEADDRPGGHACTIAVPTRDAGTLPVDVGFLVFNDRNYPRFEALLADLGIASRVSDMSFSVSDGEDFEYAGNGVRGLFANPRHLRDRGFLRMVGEYARFNRAGRRLLATPPAQRDPSLRAWLREEGFSPNFVERLIVPQASAVWSADPEQLWSFPARFLLRFFDNHGMLAFRNRPTWRTVVGGSRAYVDALVQRLGPGAMRLSTPVREVTRTSDGVRVNGERFDEAVLAGHADQSLAVLADATPAERAFLAAFPYLPSELVLHTDTGLLPRRRAAWASWNAHLAATPRELPTVSYWLSNLQGHTAETEFVATLNLTERIDPAKILTTMTMAHPVFTPAGVAAQERFDEVSGTARVHFAGAYLRWGFHEDGVWSGERAAQAILERPAAPSHPEALAA